MAQPDATQEGKKMRREIEKIRENGSISEENKDVLFQVRNFMEKEGLEDSTARRRLEVLRILLDEGNVDIDLSEQCKLVQKELSTSHPPY